MTIEDLVNVAQVRAPYRTTARLITRNDRVAHSLVSVRLPPSDVVGRLNKETALSVTTLRHCKRDQSDGGGGSCMV